MKKTVIVVTVAAMLAACDGLSIKGGASLTVDSPAKRQNMATAEIMLSRSYGNSELNLGARHISNVDAPDKYNGVNGIFVEMRQTLFDFKR